MERCRDRGGDYIEGDNISIVWFFFNKGLEHESGFFIATPRTNDIHLAGITIWEWNIEAVRPKKPLTNFLPYLYTAVKVNVQNYSYIFSSKMNVSVWTLNEEL